MNASRLKFQVAAAGVAGMCLSAVAAAVTVANMAPESAAPAAAARAAMVAVPIAVGLYVWYRRPAERFGRLLVWVGISWFPTTLAESGDSLLYSVGRVSGWMVELGLIWLVLAFPSGRLTARVDRALVWVTAALVALLYLPTALLAESYPVPSPFTSCATGCPENAFQVLGSEPLAVGSVLIPLRELLTVLLFIAVTARLMQRVRRASSLMRRTLAPVLTVAIVHLVITAVAIGARRATPESPVLEPFVWASALTVPLMAVAFFVGLFESRLYVADALQEVGMRVRGRLTRDQLRTVLSEALEDPSLELVYRGDGGPSQWIDAQGRPVEPPGPDSGRWLSDVRAGDRLVAGIVHDAALRDQSEFVQAVASYAVIALENQRLSAKVDSSVRELRESRARILIAGDRERHRIERDLHDGAQQRLVALRIQLELTEELLGTHPDHGLDKLHSLGEEIEKTLDEIRALARGVYPAQLAHRGLADALRAAALRLPMAAIVEPDGIGRYPQEVENAVYFCCLEAMQNASKHAPDAHSVTIILGGGDALVFEVRDDGGGFDDSAAQEGAGLTNMRDRLAAIGGAVEIRSVLGRGTVVTGKVPLDGDRGVGSPPVVSPTPSA